MKLSFSELGWVLAVVCAAVLVGVLVYWPEQKPDKPAAAGKEIPAPGRVALPPKADTYEVIGWRKGLRNYVVKYDDRLYRAGRITSPEGIEAMKEWGIRTILSIAPDAKERELAKAAGIRLVEVPFDKKTGLRKETLAKFLAAVKTGTGPFYLHCLSGCQRAGVLAVAYRMHVDGWDFNKAAVEFGRLGGSLKSNHKLLEVVRASK